MGYCIAPENLMTAFRKVHQYMVFSVNTPVQYALAEFMETPAHYTGIEKMYQEKRDYFADKLKSSRFKLLSCSGSYFQLADYSAISDEKDTDFAVRLTREHGVASIPVSVFYKNPVDNKILRFCFAKEEGTLKKAAELLCKV
jgi:methionine aminotransferase